MRDGDVAVGSRSARGSAAACGTSVGTAGSNRFVPVVLVLVLAVLNTGQPVLAHEDQLDELQASRRLRTRRAR